MERPSQKLIAQTLGISTAAVSLALRDTGTISQALADKVKNTAKQLGYRPNPILASLASKRFRDARIIDGIPIAYFSFSHSPTYPMQLKMRAEELGYSLSKFTYDELMKYNSPTQMLVNRGVQGIVIQGQLPRGSIRDEFGWDQFSVVQCGRFRDSLPFDLVRPNIFDSVRLAYHETRKLGYRRIGFAVGAHDPIIEDDEARISAALGITYIESAEEDRIPPFTGKFHDAESFNAWAQEHSPECVIGFHIGQCAYLTAAGVRVPEDIGFASLHVSDTSNLGDERQLTIAGANQNKAEIAKQAINLLDQHIRHHVKGPQETPRSLLISSTWKHGESLPPKTRTEIKIPPKAAEHSKM